MKIREVKAGDTLLVRRYAQERPLRCQATRVTPFGTWVRAESGLEFTLRPRMMIVRREVEPR